MQLLGRAASGEWLLLVAQGNVVAFASEVEARQAMSKIETARAILGCVQTLTTAMDTGADVWQEFWDVTNARGAYTDEELAALGITAAELAGCVTLLDNLRKFFGNEPVSQDAYRVVVNNVRRTQV